MFNGPVTILKPDAVGIPVLHGADRSRKSALKRQNYDSKNTNDPLRGLSNLSATANLMESLNLSPRKSSRMHSRNTSHRGLAESTFQHQIDFEGYGVNMHLKTSSPSKSMTRIKTSFNTGKMNATWAID